MSKESAMGSVPTNNGVENPQAVKNTKRIKTTADAAAVEMIRRGKSEQQIRKDLEKFKKDMQELEEKYGQKQVGDRDYEVARSILGQGIDLLQAALGEEEEIDETGSEAVAPVIEEASKVEEITAETEQAPEAEPVREEQMASAEGVCAHGNPKSACLFCEEDILKAKKDSLMKLYSRDDVSLELYKEMSVELMEQLRANLKKKQEAGIISKEQYVKEDESYANGIMLNMAITEK